MPTIERLLQQYIRTERARYDPRCRKLLEELDDQDALFLTRTGKAYSRSAYYHHWKRLFALVQSQFKKEEAIKR